MLKCEYTIVVDLEDEANIIQRARLGGLKSIATVDTMVTVVDAARFLDDLATLRPSQAAQSQLSRQQHIPTTSRSLGLSKAVEWRSLMTFRFMLRILRAVNTPPLLTC